MYFWTICNQKTLLLLQGGLVFLANFLLISKVLIFGSILFSSLGHGGGEGLFYFFILFNLVLTKLQDAFYRF